MKKLINCSVCKKPLSGRQQLFCSSSCKNHVHQSYEAQKERALERKLSFIKSMGGKCTKCGYHENLAALSFHHRSGKEYELDTRSLSNRGLASMLEEITKCDLLCANCRMELHFPNLNLAKLSTEPTALTTELQARKSREGILPHDATKIITENEIFEKKFKENLASINLSTSDIMVVGVSGGIDSVVLLNLLNCLEAKIKPKIIVAHLNHGYREDSDNDEVFVSKLASNLGLLFASKKLDRHSDNLQNVGMSNNLEEYFRDERRAFLEKVAKNYKAKYICLGHNADDQAETVIMNLVRGSGPAGLGGMHRSEGKIIRPLLNISRSEIEAYALQNSIKWHEDSTNQDTNFDRNYTRHHIMPLLSRLNPGFLESINRSAWIQRRVDEALRSEASKILDEFKDDVKSGQNLPKPLIYEIFGQMYERIKGDRRNLNLKNLQDLEKLISETSGTKEVSLPSNIIARRTYYMLDFLPKMKDNKLLPSQHLTFGKSNFGKWQIEIKNSHFKETSDKYTCYVPSLEKLLVRTAKPGDKIKLLGTGGTKKLQDVFTDAKIDKDKRKAWPVVERSGTIIWVPGLAYADIEINNNKVIKIKIQGKLHEESTKAKKE